MPSLLPDESSEVGGRLRLRRWSDPAIFAVAFIALASGFGQYGAVAALGDVSKQLGHVAPGGSITDKVGLSGTSLGVGLAIIRLASLGSLPLIGIADRLGRRRVILGVTIVGLALTVVAAASTGYWWFVVIFAFGRPLLSATNALAEVMAAEETVRGTARPPSPSSPPDTQAAQDSRRSCTAWRRGRSDFRGIFALALVPLVAVYAIRGRVEEPSRFTVAEAAADHPTPVLGAVGRRYRGRARRVGTDRLRHLGGHRAGEQLRVLVRTGRLAPAGLRHGGDGGCRRADRPHRVVGRALDGGSLRAEAYRHDRPGGCRLYRNASRIPVRALPTSSAMSSAPSAVACWRRPWGLCSPNCSPRRCGRR